MANQNLKRWLFIIFNVILISMLLCNVTAGSQNDKAVVVIPRELDVLMAGWEDNFNKVRTLQADVQFNMEDARFLECKDLDNKSYPDQNASIQIWKDNDRFRTDIVYDRTFDVRSNKVHYNLPYGEYIMPTTEWNQRKEELKRKHGVLETTTRFMQLEDKSYWYTVESKDFKIDRISDFFPGPKVCKWMWKGSVLAGRTFPEYIRRKAALSTTKSFVVEDLGKGRYAVQQNFTGTRNGAKVSGKTRIVIDTKKGYTVESFSKDAGGYLIYDAEYNYEKVGDAWILVGADYKDYDWRAEVNKVKSNISLAVDVDSLKVNEPVDENIFTVESLGIEKGSLVRDSIARKKYLYNDVPLHLKIALVEAKSIIDQSPEYLAATPDDVDTVHTTKPDPVPVVSQAEQVPLVYETDTSGAIQSTTSISYVRTLIVGIVIGAAVVVAMALLYWKQKFGRLNK